MDQGSKASMATRNTPTMWKKNHATGNQSSVQKRNKEEVSRV